MLVYQMKFSSIKGYIIKCDLFLSKWSASRWHWLTSLIWWHLSL